MASGGWSAATAPWRVALYAALSILIVANLIMVALQGALILSGSDAVDFATYRAATTRFLDGTLYVRAEWWYFWRYSPVAVPLFIPVAVMGETAWRLLHGVALLGLRGPARYIALASYPFWFDVSAGNVMIFVAVAAFWAVRGNRWAIGATLLLALFIPRPLMVPLVIWLLWKHPRARWPFGIAFTVHLLAVAATGYGSAWLSVLAASRFQVSAIVNVAPSALIGGWWLILAVPASVLLILRDRPATAGLLLQPYWLPYYLLMPLADRWPELRLRLPGLHRTHGEHDRR
jgi:hypothetical protein